MADLEDFIEDITIKKLSFCAVCFRTEKDRKIVPPIALSNFIKYTSLDQLSGSEYACIYCEQQAAAALKLYRTLCSSRHVSRVLWALTSQRTMTAKSIAYLLPSKIRGQVSGPNSVKRTKLLASLRKYQTYAQTDVLVVDARGNNNVLDNRNSEVLVIDDDDEIANDSRANIPRLVPIEKLLQPKPTIIDPPKTIDTDNIVLYPIKSNENNDTQYIVINNNVSDSNKQIVDNTFNITNGIPVLLSNGTIVLTQEMINQSQIVLPTNDNVQNHNITINKDYVRVNTINTVDDIILPDKSKIGDNILLKQALSKGNNNIGPLRNMVDNIKQTADFMSQMVDSMSQSCDGVSQMGNNMSETVDSMCQITDLRSLQANVLVEKPPEPKKTDKNIDWEDKIPMDVISFMDAMDPNAPNLIAKTNPPVNTPKHAVTPTQSHNKHNFTPTQSHKSHTPSHNFTPTNSYAPNVAVIPTNHIPKHSVTPDSRVNSTIPVVTKQLVPPVDERIVITRNPSTTTRVVIPVDQGATNSPNVLNHSLELLVPTKRGPKRRKKKVEDDDDVIIVL